MAIKKYIYNIKLCARSQVSVKTIHVCPQPCQRALKGSVTSLQRAGRMKGTLICALCYCYPNVQWLRGTKHKKGGESMRVVAHREARAVQRSQESERVTERVSCLSQSQEDSSGLLKGKFPLSYCPFTFVTDLTLLHLQSKGIALIPL